MKIRLCLAVAAIAAASAAYAQNIVGDWEGTLPADPSNLHLLVHIAKSADGAYQGTMDCTEQGLKGLTISSFILDGPKVTFRVGDVHGSFEGKISADGNSMEGTWTQSRALALVLKRVQARAAGLSKPVQPAEIAATWLGTVNAGPVPATLVLHLAATEGGLSATMDSPGQALTGVPVKEIKLEGAELALTVGRGAIRAEISGDLQAMTGTFSQGGASLPVAFKRVTDAELKAAIAPPRPQNPVKPYPYREEDVTYENHEAGIKLAATLTIPQGQGPFPAVVLITGSGAQDRDETMEGHKPFLVLADYLTRKGIAVLRTDDRGTAKSGGNFATATSADFATDAESGLVYLKARPEIDAHKIGIIGHSEGGGIAPMIAARNRDVAFIVIMAGFGVRGDLILPAQAVAGNEAEGMSHEAAVQTGILERQVLELIENEKDPAALRRKMHQALKDQLTAAQIEQNYLQMTSPRYRYFLAYDPAVELRKVRCPVLALNGSKDTQVLAGQNLPAIRKALEEGGNRDFEVDEMPGLNHLFQPAKTGGLSEYRQIAITIAPEVLEKISGWILKR